jgi:hypothetical protein
MEWNFDGDKQELRALFCSGKNSIIIIQIKTIFGSFTNGLSILYYYGKSFSSAG